jgi:dTMP kinase
MKQFVTFEGIDGSGKTTIAKLVYQRLRANRYKVVLTYEPTNSWIGKCVQNCIETGCDPFVTAFTFIADRIEHCKQIKQWLEEGNIVLCDRYAESTYAYQGAQLQKEVQNPMQWLQELSKGRILSPDRTFLFIIDPKVSLARIQNRKTLIPFERLSFLKQVHRNYLKLIDGPRFHTIDGTGNKEELAQQCYDDILS